MNNALDGNKDDPVGYGEQFVNALRVMGGSDTPPTSKDYMFHIVTVFWKVYANTKQ